MEQILPVHGPYKETVVIIMMIIKNMKVKVRSVDEDTDLFDIVAGVLQRDILAPYLFIICQDYVLRTLIDLMKEKGFILKKARSKQCFAEIITDAHYSDDVALLTNTTTQAESQLHNLEQAAGGIGVHVKADKTFSNQRRHFLSKWGGSLKLVDKFTYIGSSVSSTENDIST